MKRCPQCLFIYPESDQRCDFDNTPLVAVKDSEIDAATKPPRRRNKTMPIVIAVAVVAAMVSFAVYRFGNKNEQPPAPMPVVVAESLPEAPVPTPSPSPSVSPSPSPKASPERLATSHTKSSLNPISTGTGTKQRKAIILLTDGGKIDADEVWRTRDGVWYRRNGLVTLLKHGRVKSIVNQ
ncbi:MAG TPA: hypothetical protein VFZ22_23245 [Pyrinomonadaceae bacterium]|nr:hypothetical protein [Pyrinomonadaceae bacterium]